MEIINQIIETDEGYDIVTDKQTIVCGISQGQSCCENYGSFMSLDKFDEFIGAELYNVRIVDDQLNTTDYENLSLDSYCATMFVNFETSKGTLQFTAYNSHNGYYGHQAWVRSEQIEEECIL